MSREMRAPAMRRSSMFAPPPSVPSGNSRLGGANTGPTFSFGSSPMMSGPKMARKTKTARNADRDHGGLVPQDGARDGAPLEGAGR
jgi:hypothetical protein